MSTCPLPVSMSLPVKGRKWVESCRWRLTVIDLVPAHLRDSHGGCIMTGYLPTLWPPFEALVSLGVMTLGFGGGLLLRSPTASERMQKLRLTMLNVGAFFAIMSLIFLATSTFQTFAMFYVPAIFMSPWAAVAAIMIAIPLFILRKYHLGTYGLFEIVGALATIFVCASVKQDDVFQRGAALTAAVYFLIRGLDNADKAKLPSKLAELASLVWKIMCKKRRIAKLLGYVALMALAIYIPSLAPRYDPPYFYGPKTGFRPASPLECGRWSVVCDEKAWREHDRLMKASEGEREQSWADAMNRTTVPD